MEIAELGDFDPETGQIPVNPIFELAGQGTGLGHTISGYIPAFFEEMTERGLIDIESFFDTEEESVTEPGARNAA